MDSEKSMLLITILLDTGDVYGMGHNEMLMGGRCLIAATRR